MTDKQTQASAPGTNMEKDPSQWVTGDEPMTGAQQSYLKTLSEQAGVAFDPSLTKAHASERIEELQKLTGRGTAASQPAEEPSVAGEEDPGAVEPETREALQGEARVASK